MLGTAGCSGQPDARASRMLGPAGCSGQPDARASRMARGLTNSSSSGPAAWRFVPSPSSVTPKAVTGFGVVGDHQKKERRYAGSGAFMGTSTFTLGERSPVFFGGDVAGVFYAVFAQAAGGEDGGEFEDHVGVAAQEQVRAVGVQAEARARFEAAVGEGGGDAAGQGVAVSAAADELSVGEPAGVFGAEGG